MILCVDGNIASGKSTFCKNLYSLLKAKGFNVVLYTEPVEKWKRVGGINLLEVYYKNTKKWAFVFQINALLNFADIEKNALIQSLNNSIVIMERSSFSIFEIFCKYLSKNVFNSAESLILQDFKKIYSSIMDNYKKILFIYIKTDYNICYERLNKRARPEERGKVDKLYLKALEELYEESLDKLCVPYITVDGISYDKNSIEDSKILSENQNVVNVILAFIQSYK